ncbi:LOW QUALITY PROTEIN: uncharacterized protein LOC105424359 [Pogonomyrmex barbatus]|uniref:LOW QUALITY PROTEIN: uncharacterized protein LOC105424359 n=1 Tax=Pogonomyrmex barbatus TaxID=144034 RepID=A0A6I9W339_9HYME|nr:LOW QUALITY PROTEIN: uncharacterized protein LOC105424359 [Pogonomyrmex barbatus]
MMGSRRCEYCYCISGSRRCVRPKCLLPLPGCTPLYAPHSCCPVAYNCTHHHSSTMAPVSGNGCRVGERTYIEGEMVRDIEWKAACDNCFCAMGAIRCVPLACAPPLQGCSPIVREGQCCPSTYNCSGSIEVKATQNYASYAFISKDYAKFRKETNFFPAIDQSTNPSVEGRGHRVVEERISTSTIDFEEDSSVATYSTAWPSTMETDVMDNEILIGTVDYKSTLEVTTAATLANELLLSNAESTASFESTPASTEDADSITDSCITCSTNAYTDAIVMTTEDPSSTDGSTISLPEWTTALPELTLDNGNDENEDADGEKERNASENEEQNEDVALEGGGTTTGGKTDGIEKNKATMHPFAVSTSAGETLTPDEKVLSESSTLIIKRMETIGKRPVTSPSSTILMPDDILVMNVTVKTNVSVGHIHGVTINPIKSIPPDIEAILNITHREKSEDYDYDYGERLLLPPSLPNVRIIPFVAADALVKDKDVPSSETGYSSGSVVVPSELRPTAASGFYDIATQENRFSPPVETEGGFVPREPPYFDVPYRSTDLNLEIGTGVTVIPQITNPHRKITANLSNKCHFESVEYHHGEILPRAALCIICMCYYGEVVCSSEKCPPLKIGCRRINSEEKCCGKIVCVQTDESPTVVLDRADATAPSQRQPTVSPDPFRDVIKTEPAPDLPSLIEDMIPYLVERGITTPRTPTTSMMGSKTSAQGSMGNQLQHSSNFDFMEQVPLIQPPFDYGEETIDSSFLSRVNYGASHDVSSTDTVSLTYDPKNQIPLDGPSSENLEGVFNYDGATLTELNGTIDSSKYDFYATGQKFAKGNVSESDDLDRNSTGEEEDNRTTRYDNRTESDNFPSEDGKTTEEAAEGVTIFSLDNVLKLLFSSNTSSSNKLTETTRTPNVSSVDGVRGDQETLVFVVSSTSTERLTEETETVETSSKVLDNEIPMSVGSLLKLAGCNIYGRMYRVGRIIAELSSPCEECRCTEIGVRCKQLEC